MFNNIQQPAILYYLEKGLEPTNYETDYSALDFLRNHEDPDMVNFYQSSHCMSPQ